MDDRAYWLALYYVPGVGSKTFLRLLGEYGEPRALFENPLDLNALPERLRAGLRQPDWAAVERDLNWAQESGRALLLLDDPRYPDSLRRLPDAPPVLFAEGDLETLDFPHLAMVGSRNPTSSGRETAEAFAAHLAAQGMVVSSGLAAGIDAAAHCGALAAGGYTTAVMGCGLNHCYPPEHAELTRQIAAQGLLLSEFPPDLPPRKEYFPRRNRIISGLSQGVLVVEAALHSGSLITARLALEQGREVFAIPGSIHNPQSRGCHRLIREGAKLVETAADILEELPQLGVRGPVSAPAAPSEPVPELDSDYEKLLESLETTPLAVDRLIERSGLTPEAVSSMLLMLELRGLVQAEAGGRYALSARGRHRNSPHA